MTALDNRRKQESLEKNVTPANSLANGASKEGISPAEEAEETAKSLKPDKESDHCEESSENSKDNDLKATGEPPKLILLPTKNDAIAVVRHTAPYILVVQAESEGKFSVKVNVEMETPVGYLSAQEYPLKIFYMIMCILYSLYVAAWFVRSACNHRDFLSIKFLIGLVLLLTMTEMAVIYLECLSVNATGVSIMQAVYVMEIVSALRRSLARILVLSLSLGGTVKPCVIGTGILYFILAIGEALGRNNASSHSDNNNQLYAEIPLGFLDTLIFGWICISLKQTMKALRHQQNVVKLSLYRHFSNTLIFCVIASIGVIAYSFQYRDVCETAWQDKWIDEAFWDILFSILLLVIMVLWRPSVSNQKIKFSPLLDIRSEECTDEPMLESSSIEMQGLKNLTM